MRETVLPLGGPGAVGDHLAAAGLLYGDGVAAVAVTAATGAAAVGRTGGARMATVAASIRIGGIEVWGLRPSSRYSPDRYRCYGGYPCRRLSKRLTMSGFCGWSGGRLDLTCVDTEKTNHWWVIVHSWLTVIGHILRAKVDDRL